MEQATRADAVTPLAGARPPCAPLGRRVVAALLDLGVGLVTGWFVAAFTGNLRESGYGLSGALAVLAVALWIAYYTVSEARFGASLGKRLVGIKVVGEDGARLGLMGAVVRNVVRLVDLWFFYLIGFVAAWASPRNQRLGDRLARTLVVSSSPPPTETPTHDATHASAQSPELPPTPSRAGLWLGGGLVAGGLVAGVIVFAAGALSTGLQSAQDLEQQLKAFRRVPVPGQQELTLESGGYTLYYEGPGASEDDSEWPSFRVALAPASGDDPIPFADYEATLTYTGLGREGRALWTFSIEEPGSYRLRVFDASERRGQVAIGPSLAPPLEGPAQTAAVVALSGLGSGVAVIVVTWVWRARARHRARNSSLAPMDLAS